MPLKPTCKEVAESLGRMLISRDYTLSTAESCTGGMIGAAITAIPGSSAWFRGGIIAYDNDVKTSLLNVPKRTLKDYGAINAETVTAMALGVAQKMGTECSIAVSGIAGPGGDTPGKPVGLVFIGIYCKGKVEVFKNVFSGDRNAVREQSVYNGLKYLIQSIEN